MKQQLLSSYTVKAQIKNNLHKKPYRYHDFAEYTKLTLQTNLRKTNYLTKLSIFSKSSHYVWAKDLLEVAKCSTKILWWHLYLESILQIAICSVSVVLLDPIWVWKYNCEITEQRQILEMVNRTSDADLMVNNCSWDQLN